MPEPLLNAMPYVHQRTSQPTNQSTIQSVRQGAEDHAGRTCLLRRDSLSPDISLADTPNFCRRFCSAFLSRQATADHMSTETEIPIEYPCLCHALPPDLSLFPPCLSIFPPFPPFSPPNFLPSTTYHASSLVVQLTERDRNSLPRRMVRDER